MRLVVLGLSLSSSWGNGHATTFRALLSAFAERGHEILFLERDRPWYAAHRDLAEPDFCELAWYDSLSELERWRAEIERADAVMVGSFVPEGVAVGRWVQRHARGTTCFYDIDTPVTLARLERAFGSPCARALYCSVDTDRYRPLKVPQRWDLSYLGTYSSDRQPTLERLLIEPARARPDLRFVVAGPQYPEGIEWPANVERIEHLPPAGHPEFYAASRFTLNVTRADMIGAGWSPSVRLFEAGACGTPIISDRWPGIEDVFAPGREIVLADVAEDVIEALACPAGPIGNAARLAVLAGHSARKRAEQFEADLLAGEARQALGGEGQSRRAVAS